mgnify:CR=1 FL=1
MPYEYPPTDAARSSEHAETDVVPPMRMQNVVTKLDVSKDKINLDDLVQSVPMFEMANTFPAAIARTSYPKAVFLVFSSGKVVCTGALTLEDGENAIYAHIDTLTRYGVPGINVTNTAVCNIVTAAHCNFSLNLMDLHNNIPCRSSYDADRFPGASFKVRELLPPELKECAESVCITLFLSGACTMQGVKTERDAAMIWEYFFTTHILPRKGCTENTSSRQPHVYPIHQEEEDIQNAIDSILADQTDTPRHMHKNKRRKPNRTNTAIEGY